MAQLPGVQSGSRTGGCAVGTRNEFRDVGLDIDKNCDTQCSPRQESVNVDDEDEDLVASPQGYR